MLAGIPGFLAGGLPREPASQLLTEPRVGCRGTSGTPREAGRLPGGLFGSLGTQEPASGMSGSWRAQGSGGQVSWLSGKQAGRFLGQSACLPGSHRKCQWNRHVPVPHFEPAFSDVVVPLENFQLCNAAPVSPRWWQTKQSLHVVCTSALVWKASWEDLSMYSIIHFQRADECRGSSPGVMRATKHLDTG